MRTDRDDLDAIRDLLERRDNPGGTHWFGCHKAHVNCAARALLGEVDRLNRTLRHLLATHDVTVERGETGVRP